MSENPFVWFELTAENPSEAAKFYSSMFGWSLGEYDPGSGPVTVMTVPGQEMGFAHTFTPEFGLAPAWTPFIHSEDVDADAAKAASFGATIISDPMDLPNIGRMALVKDPQGAHFWLFKPFPMEEAAP